MTKPLGTRLDALYKLLLTSTIYGQHAHTVIEAREEIDRLRAGWIETDKIALAGRIAESAVPEAPLIEAERLSKKWLAAHPHAMMVVEHAGAMLRDALHPTAASVPSPLGKQSEHLIECMSASNNCRKNNPNATNCCSLYSQYASQPQGGVNE